MCGLATVVIVEEGSKSAAVSDTSEQTENVASAANSAAETLPPVDSDLRSSSGNSRKRKAILLPDDYHSKLAVRKLENGTLVLFL